MVESTDNIPDFPGAERLIGLLDAAVQHDHASAITATIKDSLCSLVSGGELVLPRETAGSASGHYARHLLYRSPQHGYSVVAMTWGPEQGTPLHDHAGLWCVEAVCAGRIEVTQYELLERNGEQFRFRQAGRQEAGVGSAGCLIPPHEYHTIANCGGDGTAVSLHIYADEMTICHAFEPIAGRTDWYQRQTKPLAYDSRLV